MPEPGRTFNQRLADELKDGITALEQAISFLEAAGHARRDATVRALLPEAGRAAEAALFICRQVRYRLDPEREP